MFIKGLIQVDGTAVEDSTNLIWFFWVINIKVKQIPDFARGGLDLMGHNMSAVENLNEFSVVSVYFAIL